MKSKLKKSTFKEFRTNYFFFKTKFILYNWLQSSFKIRTNHLATHPFWRLLLRKNPTTCWRLRWRPEPGSCRSCRAPSSWWRSRRSWQRRSYFACSNCSKVQLRFWNFFSKIKTVSWPLNKISAYFHHTAEWYQLHVDFIIDSRNHSYFTLTY